MSNQTCERCGIYKNTAGDPVCHDCLHAEIAALKKEIQRLKLDNREARSLLSVIGQASGKRHHRFVVAVVEGEEEVAYLSWGFIDRVRAWVAASTPGADAGEANSMAAVVPGPVAGGQPEGPSKKEKKHD